MGKKITCLGSFIVDLMCRADHLPLPGESTITDNFKMGPGGKGSNQAIAAKRAGADITLMTKIGNDLFSSLALETFKQEGFNEKFILIDEKVFTGIAQIIVDKNTSQNSIVVAPGACENITAADIDLLKPEIEKSDIFLTQLEVNLDAVEKAINIAYENKKMIVLNTAPIRPISDDLISKATIITPNEIEASILTKIKVVDKESARKASEVFFKKGVKSVIITLGKKGAYINDGNKEDFIEPIEVKVVDTTGAGDAFTGGLVTALSEGADIFEAALFATATASLSTTKIGTTPAMPFRNEIDFLLKSVQ
ncbi:MAG: ribokinase [Treponemataceae bacterium]